MKTHYMKVRDLKAACEKHLFLLLDFPGGTFAVNTKIAKIALRLKPRKDNEETDVMSYRPCSFQEYISRKAVFQS